MAHVLEQFQEWMSAQGIEHSDAITLVAAAAGCSGLALGVQATRDIAEGERLCTIPKDACLSIRTTQLADVIEAEELGGGLGLVLAVLHEMSLGEDSNWHGYFQACPPREYLPLFWSDAQLALLQGTELDGRVEADREAAREDFEEHVLPLLEKYPGRLRPDFVTLPNFHAAASLVASRAFGVDEWHGDAMVPLADIFNHKASVVELAPGYEVHGAESSDDDEDSGSEEEGSEEEGSEEEGSEGGSDDEEGPQEASSSEAEGGSGSEGHAAGAQGGGKQQHGHSHAHAHGHGGCCGGDAGCNEHHSHGHKHGSAAAEQQQQDGSDGEQEEEEGLPAVMASGPASIYGLRSANGLHLRLQMGIVDRDEETLEIVAPSAIPAGEEVHNTYGELGNAELVKKYGFALRQNPFTAVSLDKAGLLGDAKRQLGTAAWRRHNKMLRDQTEVLEEEEEPFEALPNGHISPALFVALRVLCAPEEDARSWSSIADALQLPPPAAAGAANGGAASGSDREEDGQPDLGAVQVWRVLDEDGQPLDEAAAAEGSAEQQQQQQGYAALLNAGMCRLLQQAVERRQGAYAGSLADDLQQLEQQQQAAASCGNADAAAADPAAAAAAEEQRVAERAALLLRITEQEVLRDVLTAVNRCLAALPAEEQAEQPEPKVAGKQQAKQQQGRKRKAAAAAPAAAGKQRAQRGGKDKRS
ncbi:ribosomal lysine N-methyltransferase 3 [Chlorella sorokiniana]|uniref:Ribosomal lysine N-methyltransferase 3 n=1 Tax=Chlorella sorokiniana TaxID=3076 RepID=A0A2P6TKF3_CHLSO|nr:ribosomal lysine N-methyltransferase 3 [Chlorella sorokiniana]|eukprot:PRW44560.1 ribosomal lysine N-methyltransferase 3 [Chlorella sorokiniana]